jgi:hypothetical protein
VDNTLTVRFTKRRARRDLKRFAAVIGCPWRFRLEERGLRGWAVVYQDEIAHPSQLAPSLRQDWNVPTLR